MSREAHVRFYESLGVKLPGATHPGVRPSGRSNRDAEFGTTSKHTSHKLPLLRSGHHDFNQYIWPP